MLALAWQSNFLNLKEQTAVIIYLFQSQLSYNPLKLMSDGHKANKRIFYL